jgi:ABC-type lipoprotein release transport system permease subunit
VPACAKSPFAPRSPFGVEPNDPRAFFAALLSLSIAGVVASVIPAKRAASVDPVVALRAE